jgi:hypothetical protein
MWMLGTVFCRYPGRSYEQIPNNVWYNRDMKFVRSQLSRSTEDLVSSGRTKPVVTPEYIVGLTDGEGCFYVNLRKSPANGIGWVETHFYIKVRIEDQPMLEKVRAALGCGGIYFQKENRPNHTPCCRYEVNSRKDIREVIIPLFTEYPLQSEKYKDFLIFKQIAEMIDRKEHQTPDGFEKISQLKFQMNYRTRRVREIRSLGGNSKPL